MTYTTSIFFMLFLTMMGYSHQDTASITEKILLIVAIVLNMILCLIHEKRLLDDIDHIKEKINKNQEEK